MTSNQGNPGEVRIPMPEIVESDFIREKIQKLKSAFLEGYNQRRGLAPTAKPIIQRVPHVLHRFNWDFKKYFEPRSVSFGPLHHGNPMYERAEQSKLKLAAFFVHENETTDDALFHKIKEDIKDLRKCYNPEDIQDYSDEELAWMFFVDGCALLYSVHYGLQGDFDRLNTTADFLVFAYLDLFLLENQLPYRVLEILIGSTTHPQMWEQSITGFIGTNISTNILGGQKRHDIEEERQDYAHLLERFREKFLTGAVERASSSMIGRMFMSCGDNRKDWKTFHSIKELRQSGIHVRPSKSNNLKDISFCCNFRGCLQMPRLQVDDSTASKFMNMVAFEKCRDIPNGFEVTSYLCFLGSLIETAEDVKELRVTGLLHNYYGNDEEVADLIRRMSRDLVPDPEIYWDVTENIQKYCNSGVVWIYSHYFSRNWSFIAFSGAIAGLVLTLIQTYFSINPKSKQN